MARGSYYRKRSKNSSAIFRRIERDTRVKWIAPVFPPFARTSVKTEAGIHAISKTLSDGFLLIGTITAADFDDPLGDLDVIGLDGAIDADSLFEGQGHDKFNLIYNSYRVLGSTLVFNIQHDINPTQVSFDDTDGAAGASTSGTFTSIQHDQLYLVIIPSSIQTTAIHNWHELMHYPWSRKIKLPGPGRNKSGKMVSIKISIPDHVKMHNLTFQDNATDQGQVTRMLAFNAGASNGQHMSYQVYLADSAGSSSATNIITYKAKLYQQILMSKIPADDQSVAVTLGDDFKPTTTG